MLLKDSTAISGSVDIVLSDAYGKVKETRSIKNLVVQSGKSFIAHRMTGSSNVIMSHMAIGTGTTSPQTSDTSLQAETARVSLVSGITTANTIQYIAFFPGSSPEAAISEAGIFNSASGGEMLCRTVFGVINKSTIDTLTVTWNITIN